MPVQLAPENEGRALRYLAAAPYENVFLVWLIEQMRGNGRADIYVYVESEQVHGVAFFGRQVVLAADTGAAIDAFAQTAPGYRFERMIVAPRGTVERYWQHVRAWHPPPRVVRESQPLLAIDAETLRITDGGVRVRHARPDEWSIVAANSAEMIRQELEYDPQNASSEFDANVRAMIARRLWWVGEKHGRLVFFCNAGPHSDQTLQLQGIWTPAPDRGHGLATAALSQICRVLLADVPSVSLYVNAFNTPALALYDRVGFRQVGEFATLLF